MNIKKINNENNNISFTKLVIAKPQIWPTEVLDTFVKNKDVQKLTADYAAEGKDLIANCLCDKEKCLLSIFKELNLIHSVWGENIKNLQKNIKKFSLRDIKSIKLDKEKQKRLDNIEQYINEFNKTLETQ